MLHQEGGAGLWRDPDLQIALRWRKQNNPNQVWARRYHPEFASAIGFLDQSRRRKRYLRLLYGALVAAVVIMLVGMAWSRQRALIERKADEVRQGTFIREQQAAAALLEHTKSISKLQESALAGLMPEAAEAALQLLAKAKLKGINVRIIDGYRSSQQQQERIAEGRARTKVSTT